MHQFSESERIEALKHDEILEFEIDIEFKEFTELASLICQTSFALITLTDSEKQWLKSENDFKITQKFHENSFCDYVFENPKSILEVQNAHEDKRFSGNPFVKGEAGIVFCAAVPLVLQSGNVLGALCIMDKKPRKLTDEQLRGLKILGIRVVKQILLYKNLVEQKKNHRITYQRLYDITSQSPDYIFTLDRDLKITYFNHFGKGGAEIRWELIKQQKILYEAQKISQTGSCEWDIKSGEAKFSDELYNILGIERSTTPNHINALKNLIHPDDVDRAEKLTVKAIKTLSPLLFRYRIITPKGELKYIDGRGCALIVKDNKVISALITLQDITKAVNFDKKLFNAVVQSEEKERARMAGELHDGVCQYLAGSKLMLTAIGNSLKSKNGNLDIEAITDMVHYSKTTLNDALNLTQQISRNLLPVEFHKKGVIQAVKEMTELLNAAHGIHYTISAQGNDMDLDSNISINIFRIVQEFIRNSQKYSEASQVDISIVINQKEAILEVKDNGKGFDLNSVAIKKGVGLLSMRKRIQSIGGAFTYETSPGKGVQLKLKMSLE